jgi:hypothetical protein
MPKYNILALMHKIDTPERYNYQVNFGFLDEMANLENVNLIKYDIEKLAKGGRDLILEIAEKNEIQLVTGPLHVRWQNAESLPRLIKDAGLPLVIFDNDCFQFSFSDEFYSYFDWVFYREYDKHNDSPAKGSYLPWSIDAKLYFPKYGGTGTVLCATIRDHYPMRGKIMKYLHPHTVDCTSYKGKEYIQHLQNSLMAISTGSTRFNFTAAKILEIASCGTAILTEDSRRLDFYFNKDLIFIYKDIPELKYYINYANKNSDEVIYKQKMLRKTIENHHTNEIRAREMLKVLEREIFSHKL